MAKRGAKEKLNYDQVETMMHGFGQMDVILTDCALIMGIRPETLSRYMKRHPQLRQAYKRGKAELIGSLKTSAIKKAKDSLDSTMLKYLLNNLSEYTDSQNQINLTNITNNISQGERSFLESLQRLEPGRARIIIERLGIAEKELEAIKREGLGESQS